MIWQHYCIFQCDRGHVKLGKSIQFKGHCRLKFYPGCNVSIGDDFICNSGVENSIDTALCSKIVVQKDASLIIGSHSGISNTTIHCHSKISIGNFVNIGAGTMIFDTNFHSTNWKIRENRVQDVKESINSPITIEDHVFIGAGCFICKGVTIGEKSIIAAGSVICKDVPKGEIWGGNPARYIKKIDS